MPRLAIQQRTKIIEFGTRRKVSQKCNGGIEQILVFILCLDQQVIGKQKKLAGLN